MYWLAEPRILADVGQCILGDYCFQDQIERQPIFTRLYDTVSQKIDVLCVYFSYFITEKPFVASIWFFSVYCKTWHIRQTPCNHRTKCYTGPRVGSFKHGSNRWVITSFSRMLTLCWLLVSFKFLLQSAIRLCFLVVITHSSLIGRYRIYIQGWSDVFWSHSAQKTSHSYTQHSFAKSGFGFLIRSDTRDVCISGFVIYTHEYKPEAQEMSDLNHRRREQCRDDHQGFKCHWLNTLGMDLIKKRYDVFS